MPQHCALPGCDVELAQADKGSQRKYCCPDHRAQARFDRLRAEAAKAEPITEPDPTRLRQSVEDALERRDAERDATLPALLQPRTDSDDHPGTDAHPAGKRRRSPFRPSGRSLVAAGLVVALAFGGGSVLWNGVDSPAGPPESPPAPPAGAGWVNAANVALASVNQQLSEAKAAIDRWNALPPSVRGDVKPVELRAIEEREAVLQRDRAVLLSQLAAWQYLQQSTSALNAAQANRALLTQTAPAPNSVRPSPSADAASIQRNILDGQIASLQQQTLRWQQDVAAAMNAPLPDARDTTAGLSSALVTLADHPERSNPSPPQAGSSNSVPAIGVRVPSSGDTVRAEAPSGAPPNPGEGRGSLADAASASVSGPVERGSTVLASASEPLSRSVDTLTGRGESSRSATAGSDGPVTAVAEGLSPAAGRLVGGSPSRSTDTGATRSANVADAGRSAVGDVASGANAPVDALSGAVGRSHNPSTGTPGTNAGTGAAAGQAANRATTARTTPAPTNGAATNGAPTTSGSTSTLTGRASDTTRTTGASTGQAGHAVRTTWTGAIGSTGAKARNAVHTQQGSGVSPEPSSSPDSSSSPSSAGGAKTNGSGATSSSDGSDKSSHQVSSGDGSSGQKAHAKHASGSGKHSSDHSSQSGKSDSASGSED